MKTLHGWWSAPRGNRDIWMIPAGYLVFLLIWFLFSIELYGHEGPRSYFELSAVFVSKFWLVALVFLCRQLLFPESGWPVCFRILLILFSLGFFGLELTKMMEYKAAWLYGLCVLGDGLCWSVALASFFDNLGMIYRFWILWQPSLTDYEVIRLRFQSDLLKLGLVWMAGLGLIYSYLVNFYLVDSVLYSRITAGIDLLLILSFLVLYCTKIRCWSFSEIRAIDGELKPFLDWRPAYRDGGYGIIADCGVKLNYLWLVRSYWDKMKWPRVSLWIYLVLLGLAALPFTFPRIFGVVIEVSSFN